MGRVKGQSYMSEKNEQQEAKRHSRTYTSQRGHEHGANRLEGTDMEEEKNHNSLYILTQTLISCHVTMIRDKREICYRLPRIAYLDVIDKVIRT